jgi:hypothetical protein
LLEYSRPWSYLAGGDRERLGMPHDESTGCEAFRSWRPGDAHSVRRGGVPVVQKHRGPLKAEA